MNSFRNIMALRIAGLALVVAASVGTIIHLDQPREHVPASERPGAILSWDEMDVKKGSPVMFSDGQIELPPVSLEVLTNTGTPAVYTLAQCAEEDDIDCIWLAGERGNGLGKSFVNLGGIVYYERNY